MLKLTLGLSCMSGEAARSPVLVLSGRVCSDVFGLVPTGEQKIIHIKQLF